MKSKILVIICTLSIVCLFGGQGFPQNKNKDVKKIEKRKKLKLNVHSVIEYLLHNNHDVKKLLLDYKTVSSPLREFKAKYDFVLFANGGVNYTETANESQATFSGEETTRATYALGVTKMFRTGTSITASINGMYENVEGAGVPAPINLELGGNGYQNGFKVEVAQELLKNAFGINDCSIIRKLKNVEKMQKNFIKFNLARLLHDAIEALWMVAIAEEEIKTTEVSLNSTINIRNLIQRKLRLGLSEREDLLDWNAKVIDSRSRLDQAQKRLFDAKLAILRTLDLNSKLDIEIGNTFVDTPPNVTYDAALNDAFIKRVDWNNMRGQLTNSKIDYKIAKNEELPSLKLKFSMGSSDYNEKFEKTFDTYNQDYYAGLEFTYPLGNTGAAAKMRKARVGFMKQKVELNKLEKEIRDSLLSLVKECKVGHKIYIQTKQSREYKQKYYYQVLMKFKRGRFTALQLKLALDAYIMSMSNELRSLVGYNIALLRRDLARNVIFEKYGIPVDSILKRIEN